jgi:hypothetical protein
MNAEEKLKLINQYKNGDAVTKLFLEKKYGRHQIRQVVENQLTSDYLKVCISCYIFEVYIFLFKVNCVVKYMVFIII